MRVLVLSKYGRRAASPRHRFLAFEPYLAKQGIHLHFSPLLDDDYLKEKLDQGGTSIPIVAASYLKRIAVLLKAREYDLLLVHCELFPYLPPWFEQILAKVGVPYVFDYDDAIFHMYDEHSSKPVRMLLGSKIAKVIAGAKVIMAGSEYLARYARDHNANVHVVPTVVDLERYRIKDWDVQHPGPFTIGWIGSPSTVRHLALTTRALERLGSEKPLRLHVIGAPAPRLSGVDVQAHPWSEETEVALLLRCDVGIMPLFDEPFTRGKCAFKLIQYMGCALPTIASPVGANAEVVTGETGIWAEQPEDWFNAFALLDSDSEKRRIMGVAGRRRCEEKFSVESQKKKVEQILRQAATSSSRRFG